MQWKINHMVKSQQTQTIFSKSAATYTGSKLHYTNNFDQCCSSCYLGPTSHQHDMEAGYDIKSMLLFCRLCNCKSRECEYG